MPKGIPASGKRVTKATAKRLSHDGKTMTVDEWAAEIGLTANAISARLRKGLPVCDALQPGRNWAPGRVLTTKYEVSGGREVQRIVAEKALGKPLPLGAEVHHVDGNGRNNAPSNLVICPDKSYHRMLHVRTAALEACGNANCRKCVYCQQYDDPANMRVNRSAHHVQCKTAYEYNRRSK